MRILKIASMVFFAVGFGEIGAIVFGIVAFVIYKSYTAARSRVNSALN